MKVTVHDRFEAVGAPAWTTLHARTGLRSPFLTWLWQTEWAREFAHGHRVEIWRLEDGDETVVALLALYEAEPGRLELVGGADVSDYLDLLALGGREEEAWAALLEARAAATAAWVLHAVPAASPTVTKLPALARAVGLDVKVAVEERCPVLTLPVSWDAYLDALPSKPRHELLRKMRRLEREAPEARPWNGATRAEIETRLGDFFDLHRRSRAGKARFMDPGMEGFFRRVVCGLADLGMARLWFLDTSGGPIATFLTIEWDGTVGLYNSGFHPNHAALSPGLMLLTYLIRDAIARDKRRFDFLRGEERYKYDFGPTPEEVHAVRIAPAGRRPR